MQTNFSASPKYPVQLRLFDIDSRPPSQGGNFPGCEGGMVAGDAGGFTLGTHGGSLRACPQPRRLTALCFPSCSGALKTWAFLTRLHDPTLALPLARLDCSEWTLPPGPFLSADSALAQKWKFPPRTCRKCLPGGTNLRKVGWRLAPTSQLGQASLPALPMTPQAPAMPCSPCLSPGFTSPSKPY